MILVRPTGGGKSLVYQVVAFMNKGVTLFISPLLALASNQMQKIRKKVTSIPHIGSLHLDGMKPSTIKTIAGDISHMKHPETGDCYGCMILFVSPQLLVSDCGKPILEAVMNNQSSALHMVVMDEVHIALDANLGTHSAEANFDFSKQSYIQSFQTVAPRLSYS